MELREGIDIDKYDKTRKKENKIEPEKNTKKDKKKEREPE